VIRAARDKLIGTATSVRYEIRVALATRSVIVWLTAGAVIYIASCLLSAYALSNLADHCEDVYVPALTAIPTNVWSLGCLGAVISGLTGPRVAGSMSFIVAPRPLTRLAGRGMAAVMLCAPVALVGQVAASAVYSATFCGTILPARSEVVIQTALAGVIVCCAWCLIGVMVSTIFGSRVVGVGLMLAYPIVIEPMLAQGLRSLIHGDGGQTAASLLPYSASSTVLRQPAAGVGPDFFAAAPIGGGVSSAILLGWLVLLGTVAVLADQPHGASAGRFVGGRRNSEGKG